MKGKKVIALVLTGMIAAGILSGCGQTKGGSESTPASVDSQSGKDTAAEETGAKSDVTLTVAAAQDWIKDWDRKVAEEFTAETGIKIEFQLNPNDQYTNIVKAIQKLKKTDETETANVSDSNQSTEGKFTVN